MCVYAKWCCQHGSGGARGLFFQITSSQLVRVRGRINWHQGHSLGDVCSPPVRWPPAERRGPKKNPSIRTNQAEGRR